MGGGNAGHPEFLPPHPGSKVKFSDITKFDPKIFLLTLVQNELYILIVI